jgi:hypothetical protein
VNGIQLALRRAEASQARVVKLPVHIQDTLAQLRHRSRELQVSATFAMLYSSRSQTVVQHITSSRMRMSSTDCALMIIAAVAPAAAAAVVTASTHSGTHLCYRVLH